MRVLLDTNVVLDVLLQRAEWLADAERVWQASADGRLTACITASTITDIYYVSRRLVGQQKARDAIRACLDTLSVLSVDHATLTAAFARNGTDFEDDVQMASAQFHGLDAIVTRDAGGFSGSAVTVISPKELIERLAS
ncbi:MAG TPA: PIN domain-containing protein [Pirellulales bacterium]|nr:PIN domain-containing protein [Pirellulales bacterium]